MVRRIARLLRKLPGFLRRHRVQLALSIRVTIAALAALALAQLLQLPLPLWAVLTAVIVTQMSVGRSLMATFDYLVGTLGGAIYGGAIGVLIPHGSEIALLAVLALAVTPLTFIAAINPRFSVAPITAIIVLLIPTMTHASAFTSAVDRVIEVALGGVTGLVISFLLLPSSAHPQVVEAAARTLNEMARAPATCRLDARSRRRSTASHSGRYRPSFGARERRRGGGRARALDPSCRGARHRTAVAHAAAIAPRPGDHRQSGDDPAARILDAAARRAAGAGRQGVCRLFPRRWGCAAGGPQSAATRGCHAMRPKSPRSGAKD
jgi:uncharacterized membrane protein YccC